LAFRYDYATEALTTENLTFRPSETSMTILELLNHIYQLAKVTDCVLNNQEIEKINTNLSFELLREETLKLYIKSSKEIKKMTYLELVNCTFKPKNKSITFPFWNLINGSIADALTHVGQLNSWRRISGNPVPKNNPCIGEP